MASFVNKHGILHPCPLNVLLGCCSHRTIISSGPLLGTKGICQEMGYEL